MKFFSDLEHRWLPLGYLCLPTFLPRFPGCSGQLHRNWNEGPTNPTDPLHSSEEKRANDRARAMKPPSTSIAVPVIHSDSSPARNNAALAISSGWPARRMGCASAKARSLRSLVAPPIGVLIPPGQMQLTRMRYLPNSTAAQ